MSLPLDFVLPLEFVRMATDPKRIPPALQKQLEAISARKAEVDAKLAFVRAAGDNAAGRDSPLTRLPQPPPYSGGAAPSEPAASALRRDSRYSSSLGPTPTETSPEMQDPERKYFTSGYLAIDAARQSLISATSQRIPPPQLLHVAVPHPLPAGSPAGPDPLERARAALGRSSAVQAESSQITAMRDALREQIASEGAELSDVDSRLADTSAQLQAVQADLVAKTSEVEALRAQLSELMRVTSELLRVVDPEWHELRSPRQQQQPVFWDATSQSPSSGTAGRSSATSAAALGAQASATPSLLQGPPAPSASSFDGLLRRLDLWAARHDAVNASL